MGLPATADDVPMIWWTAAVASSSLGSTGSRKNLADAASSSRTPKMITPRIKCCAPSRRVPRISHSDQMTSPSTTLAITEARMSGTAAKICSQFDTHLGPPVEAAPRMDGCVIAVVVGEAVDEGIEVMGVRRVSQAFDHRR